MEFIFWKTLSLIIYCYLGYPFLLWLRARLYTSKIDKKNFEPSVSVVISAYNEEDVIEKKIENLLSLNYPKDKLEILIGSDGSTDKTNDIVKTFKDKRIQLFAHKDRRGKIAVLNELVKKAGGEIIVFTDCRQTFAKGAISELVKNFADQKVGCVSGELIFGKEEGATAKGINLYWNYEKFIRKNESRIHSMLGATGAIYAIRKDLYAEAPADIVLDDMFIPFKIIEKGYRAIFDNSAKAYDEVAKSATEEYTRKTRTLFGNYQIFWIFKKLFNPATSPIAVQLFSHKFLRVIVPFLLIILFISNILVFRGSISNFYFLLLLAQILFYWMALVGTLLKDEKYGILKSISNLCYVPYMFCLLNFSAIVAFSRFLFLKQDVRWRKARAGKTVGSRKL